LNGKDLLVSLLDFFSVGPKQRAARI
jgi:hypothetical protein